MGYCLCFPTLGTGDPLKPLAEELWPVVSGGEIVDGCGLLISGKSMLMSGLGERILMTRDLDLSVAR